MIWDFKLLTFLLSIVFGGTEGQTLTSLFCIPVHPVSWPGQPQQGAADRWDQPGWDHYQITRSTAEQNNDRKLKKLKKWLFSRQGNRMNTIFGTNIVCRSVMWAVYELKLKIRSATVSDSHTHILEKSSHQPNNLTLSPKAQTVLDVCRWFSFLLDSLTGCVFFLLMALLCCSQSCHFHTHGCADSLTEAETYPNMQLNFEHKLQDWSAETGLMTFAR